MNSALESWLSIPDLVEKSVAGLSDEALDRRGGAEGASLRENVHHILESNLVAVTIVLAALAPGSPGHLMPDSAGAGNAMGASVLGVASENR